MEKKEYKKNKKRRNPQMKRSEPKPEAGSFPNYKPQSEGNNDIAWYAKSEQLLKDAASLPFSQQLGLPMRIDPATPDAAVGLDARVPGLCTIYYRSVPGISTDNVSPVNVAARAEYSFVRHANSGSKNYDSPDLMQYYLAMDSAYSFLFFMRRIYAIARVYSTKNRFLNESLIHAMRVNAEDVQANLANLRGYINVYTARIAQFCVPANKPLFRRTASLMEHIYTDSSDVAKAQIYLFQPTGWYRFDEFFYNGGQLEFVPWITSGSATYTVADIINFGNNLINKLIESEDIGIMSGDILKAYGKENLFTLSYTAEDFTILPEYDELLLSQIENLTTVVPSPFSTSWENANITQDLDTGAIIYNPTVFTTTESSHYQGPLWNQMVLNSRHASPNPGDVMESTRLMSFTTIDSEGHITIATCGTEVVECLRIISDPTATSFGLGINTMSNISQPAIMQLSNFDWHPMIYLLAYDTPNGAVELVEIGKDLDNYTLLDVNTKQRMDLVALLSLFDVPAYGIK